MYKRHFYMIYSSVKHVEFDLDTCILTIDKVSIYTYIFLDLYNSNHTIT